MHIQATYLVQPGSDITKIEEVDQPGVRIVVKARSAYDLWLTENIKHAEIIRTKTIEDSFNEFCDKKYEVLAGLKPKLLEEAKRVEGSRLLPGSFTVIGQSVGMKKGLTVQSGRRDKERFSFGRGSGVPECFFVPQVFPGGNREPMVPFM